MRSIEESELGAISAGNEAVLETLEYISECFLVGSFLGLLAAPITSPHIICISGLAGGIYAIGIILQQ